MWLNLVERVLWEHEVAGSSPVIQTIWDYGVAVSTAGFYPVSPSSNLGNPTKWGYSLMEKLWLCKSTLRVQFSLSPPIRGCNSMVECCTVHADVAGSNPVTLANYSVIAKW